MEIKPGAYRTPLTAGLIITGEDKLAGKVSDQSIKLALSNSIQGNVASRTELTEIFIEALQTKFARNSADDDVVEHYLKQLHNGSIVPVENTGTINDNRYYAPGELFFRS